MALLLLLATSAHAQAVMLRCLEDFQAGAFRIAGPGSGNGRECLASPADLAMAGRSAGPGCRITLIRDEADSGVISWSCPDGRSGRSEVRRDAAGIYTVSAQGVEGGLPWARRGEWRRIGPCN